MSFAVYVNTCLAYQTVSVEEKGNTDFFFLMFSCSNCKRDQVSDEESISGLRHTFQPPTNQHSIPVDPFKLERQVIT